MAGTLQEQWEWARRRRPECCVIKEDLIQYATCLDKGKKEEKVVKDGRNILSLDKQEDDGTDMGKSRGELDFG